MNKLIDYFVGKSLLVNLVTALIIVLGTLSMFSLDKETFPNVDFEVIIVNTVYPGSTAEDVESLVSIPIERKLNEVDGLEEINIMSGEGYSIAAAKVDPAYDINEVRDEIRNKIESIKNFPADVETPVVQKIESKNRPVVKIGLIGNTEKKLRDSAKKLREKIEENPRVSSVSFTGQRDRVFYINVDLAKLNEEELTLAEVSRAIYDRRLNLTAGSIERGSKTLMVRTFNEFSSVDDIKNIVIRSNYSGRALKVSDISEVVFEFKDRTSLKRVSGANALMLEVKMKPQSDLIAVTEYVKDMTKKQAVNDDKTVNFEYHFVNESAFFVKRRLGILASNGLVGIVLVFICLMFFLNFRVSLITSLGAPLAFMVAFIFMGYLNISLNLISMFGLILVLGMLVDDSIIVAENFYQKLEAGMEPKEAASVAAKETLLPVTTTIITTIIAFGSLFLLGGIWGKFLWPVPAVVLICLIASWFECFFILPSHLADFVKKDKSMEKTSWYQPFVNKYKSVLSKLLDVKVFVLFGFIALFGASAFVFVKFVDKEMFPDDDVRLVFYKIKGPVGTSLDETIKAVEKAERKIMNTLKDGELDVLTSSVGSMTSSAGTPRRGNHYGSVSIFLTTEEKRDRNLDEIFKNLGLATKNLFDKFEGKLEKAQSGKPTKAPVEIEIFGDNLPELISAANFMRDKVKEVEGVISTEIDFEEDYRQIQIKLKEKEARRLRVSNYDVALELRRAIEGQSITEVRQSDEDIDVILRLKKNDGKNENVLKRIYIPNQLGQRVKLESVADIVESTAPYIIRRKNKKRVISVFGDIDSSVAKSTEINESIEKVLEKDWKYPNLTYSLEGEFKDTQDTQKRLMKSALISLFLIFIILVSQFNSLIQPLIIMSAIPFGLIGVVAIFWILGMPIGFMALMGVIGLIGVVVNDSIVLVSFINNKIKAGTSSIKQAVLDGSVSRFRAVILTTFTTVAGILPIAHMPGGDPFLKPMAFSFAYGLMFSTTITLIFVPCTFYIYANVFMKRYEKNT